VAYVRSLQIKVVAIHKEKTDDLPILNSVSEIRIQASPDWDHSPTAVKFWFLTVLETPTSIAEIDVLASNLMALLPSDTRFQADHQAASYDDMSATDYICSERLDLDHLSRDKKSK